MYGYPFGMPPFIVPTGESGFDIRKIKEQIEGMKDLVKLLEGDKKKEGDDKKKETKKQISLSEMIIILMITGPFVGKAYLWFITTMAESINTTLQHLPNVPH